MKPSLAKGTRDFTAQEVSRRKYIINILQNNFELFGFQPLETPTFENLSTLTGKYGEEGDRLIFKILNSGDFLNDARKEFAKLNKKSIESLCEEIKRRILNEIVKFEENKKEEEEKTIVKNAKEFNVELGIILEDLYNNTNYFTVLIFEELARSNFFFELKRKLEQGDFIYSLFLNDQLQIPSALQLFILPLIKPEIKESKEYTKYISDKALRYDLTVPFARFVAMNHGQLTFPFKRYQIQPVWRADRPQKGRYREFYQCDADVVGSKSLWQEVDFVQLYFKSFQDLGLQAEIHMNNRKILSGLAEYAGITEQLIDFTVALDKLDKIGKDGVVKEMTEKGISVDAVSKLDFLFEPQNDALSTLALLKDKFVDVEIGKQGIEELEFVISKAFELGITKENLVFNITLARGLDYYTGAIFEVKAKGVEMGSIGGGGRYDDLTQMFGVKDVPGIGISFGLDRIYLVMEELNLFPESATTKVDYLFANYGDAEAMEATRVIAKLRSKNISAELYPEAAKLKKQFTYAEKKGIPNLIFLGHEEIENGTITVKNLDSGEQKTIKLEELIP